MNDWVEKVAINFSGIERLNEKDFFGKKPMDRLKMRHTRSEEYKRSTKK